MEKTGKSQQETVTALNYRSPSFSNAEARKLVDLVARYKKVILNKSTVISVNTAKENAWLKISEIFNQEPTFEHDRTADCLKTKWENLKRNARKANRNLIDVKDCPNDLTQRIAVMLKDAENDKSTADFNAEESEVNEHSQHSENDWDENVEKLSEKSMELTDVMRNRSTNFSPHDSRLLLQCIRKERDIIFSTESTHGMHRLKNRAWMRVANEYNSSSQVKRSPRILQTKFRNMKKLVRNGSIKTYMKDLVVKKHKKLVNDYPKEIKKEIELLENTEFNNSHDDGFNELHNDVIPQDIDNSSSDPLSTVLNGETITCYSQDNKEVVRLKTELLKYQLETAKMERQRVQDAMHADASERESKAIETALRLRTARLETVMAEMRLPPSHPALVYTPSEVCAQPYIRSTQFPT